MVFSSFPFLWIFLPLVFAGSLLFRKKGSNLFLLAASIIFYAWGEPKYVVLLLFSITLNYLGGLFFLRPHAKNSCRAAVCLIVFINLALLGYFKYFTFFADSVNAICGHEWISPRSIALPIGISFYTFQAISYIVDLARGEIKVQRSWFKLALYISFFPQLVAGPIVKYKDIESQLEKHSMTREGITSGMERFCFGLAKKVLLANMLGHCVDSILAKDIASISPLLSWTAAIFYTLQIYYDFSGYSDMAIGLAAAFGFRYQENFNFPYLSQSIREFWRRWHISLSTWFRDYLYIPLGGNRKGTPRTLLNLIIVFFLTGLWHGAQWNFVFWGVYHGFFLILERLFLNRALERLHCPLLSKIYTMLVVVIGWVFFRADSIGAAFMQIASMFHFGSGFFSGGAWNFRELISPAMLLLFILSLPLCGGIQTRFAPWLRTHVLSEKIRAICTHIWALLCLLLSLMLLANATHNPFIYFRF